MQETLELLRATLPSTVKIRDEIGSTDTLANVDATQIQQVLINLTTNACDAMPGGGTLRVSIEARPGRGTGSLAVAIEDTGSGIPDDRLAQVREPFFTTKASGHGLGLTICRSILWEMRGRMEIRSREGEGTRVDLLIPTAPRAETPLRRDGS